MSETTRRRRPAPPPVEDDNPPSPPAPTPREDNQVEPHPGEPTAGVTASVTNPVINVGTKVGSTVPTGESPWAAPPVTMESLLHGRVNPNDDLAQTGVRLPRYSTDAVRALAAMSRGKRKMQDIVRDAVNAYVPPELLTQSWMQHGGPVDDNGNPVFDVRP